MEPDKIDKVDAFFNNEVSKKEKRKLNALHKNNNVLSGLGMMGMIGWSVAVPTLLGAALGIWLDSKYPQSFSWTLSLLIVGLTTGCIISWYWVNNEDKEIHNDNEQTDE